MSVVDLNLYSLCLWPRRPLHLVFRRCDVLSYHLSLMRAAPYIIAFSGLTRDFHKERS